MAGLELITNALRLAAAKCQARESRDNPRLNAFCRVAPSVRFNVLAILAALVFFRASVDRPPAEPDGIRLPAGGQDLVQRL